MFSSKRDTTVINPGNRSSFGSFLLLPGVLCILFGLIVIAAPQLLAYLVAGFFIMTGISMITAWLNMKK